MFDKLQLAEQRPWPLTPQRGGRLMKPHIILCQQSIVVYREKWMWNCVLLNPFISPFSEYKITQHIMTVNKPLPSPWVELCAFPSFIWLIGTISSSKRDLSFLFLQLLSPSLSSQRPRAFPPSLIFSDLVTPVWQNHPVTWLLPWRLNNRHSWIESDDDWFNVQFHNAKCLQAHQQHLCCWICYVTN